jgi:hypothetical protein
VLLVPALRATPAGPVRRQILVREASLRAIFPKLDSGPKHEASPLQGSPAAWTSKPSGRGAVSTVGATFAKGTAMAANDAALIVLMFVVFGAPALALAARLTIRPLLEAIDRLREGVTVTSRAPDPRVDLLEAEVRRLSGEVQRLAEAEAFHRQLLDAPPDIR